MTGFQMGNIIVPAIVAQFEANAAAKVRAINDQVTDGITIPDPAQILDFAPTPATLEGALPLIGIADFPSRFEDDLVTSITGVHQFAIIVALSNVEERALAWQLRRYRSLIADLIQVDRTFGGVCRPALFDQVQPGPYLENTNPERPHSWLSWFYYLITCRRGE